MPFIEIEGVRAYQYRELPPQLQKAVTAKNLKLKYILSFALIVPFVVSIVLYAVTSFGDGTGASNLWGAGFIFVGLMLYFIGTSLHAKTARLIRDRKYIRNGSYEGHFVVPSNYSYNVVLSPAVETAMQHDETVSDKVNEFFSKSMLSYIDFEIESNLNREDVVNAKLEIIELAEKLSDELGIDQPEHFQRLCEEATTSLR